MLVVLDRVSCEETRFLERIALTERPSVTRSGVWRGGLSTTGALVAPPAKESGDNFVLSGAQLFLLVKRDFKRQRYAPPLSLPRYRDFSRNLSAFRGRLHPAATWGKAS